jgi:DNA-binding NtrC family response regulator
MSARISIPRSAGGVDCVVLSCFEHEGEFFASLLGQARIHLHRASTLEMADFLLMATQATVLISDPAFLDGSWRDVLAMTARFHPSVATLICADPVDRERIAAAGDAGVLDVLWRPVEIDTLRASIWKAHEVALERSGWIADKTSY